MGAVVGIYHHGRVMTPDPEEGSAPTYSLSVAANTDLAPGAPVRAIDWSDVADLPVGDPGKRFFDILVSLAGLVVAVPLMLLVALAVRMTSKGPILHWSQREGFKGELFWMPKFRTMHVGAPIAARELMTDADAYLTPIGSFLRASGLDELPQLWTILRGKMSLVGPRPLLPSDPAMAERRRRHIALGTRPGITGLAQVSGRNAVTPRRKARYDTFYVQKWNWALDARIIVQTVKIIFLRRGFL